MNAASKRIYALAPVHCSRVVRRDNEDGSSTLELKLEPGSQHAFQRLRRPMEYVVLARVVYRVYPSPRGDIVNLRSLAGNQLGMAAANMPPLPGLIGMPRIDDIPSFRTDRGATLYLIGVSG